jgi:hypothetical protein
MLGFEKYSKELKIKTQDDDLETSEDEIETMRTQVLSQLNEGINHMIRNRGSVHGSVFSFE